MTFSRVAYVAAAQLGIATLGLLGYFLADNPAAWLLPLMLGAWLFSAVCLASEFIPPLRNTLRRIMETPVFAWLLVLGLLAIWAQLMWATSIAFLPPLWTYLPFALFWVWLTLAFLLMISQSKVCGFVLVVGRVVVMLTISLVMLEVLLNVFVTMLPEELIERAPLLSIANESRDTALRMPPQAPIHRYTWAGKSYNYTLQNVDGDLYRLTCLEKPEPQDLYEVDIRYTEQGFRETTSGDVDLLVLGDSFTFGFFFNEPYWMNLYPNVVSMGVTGSGSLEQSMLLEAFGAERQPEVVLMAFFEGNDMQDTWTFRGAVDRYLADEPALSKLERNQDFRPLRFLSTYSAGLWLIDEIDVLSEVAYGDCIYPIEDDYGNQLTFYDKYMSMLTVDTEQLRESEVFAETRAAILAARDHAEAMNAEFILMFIPDKFHVHYPGLLDQMPTLAQEFDAFRVSRRGFVPNRSVTDPDQIAALVAANIDNQRTLLQELSEQEGFLFLDLTPSLQEAAAEGFAAYGDADTHWDQEGNDFVREVIRGFLAGYGLN